MPRIPRNTGITIPVGTFVQLAGDPLDKGSTVLADTRAMLLQEEPVTLVGGSEPDGEFLSASLTRGAYAKLMDSATRQDGRMMSAGQVLWLNQGTAIVTSKGEGANGTHGDSGSPSRMPILGALGVFLGLVVGSAMLE